MVILTRRSLLLGASALTAAGMLPFHASAQENRKYYALLVAVTAYPDLPPKAKLEGPNHDAVLVRQYLVEQAKFDPANVTLLADEVEGAAGLPTNAEIKAQFAALAEKVTRDDFVYVHMSGHGAQQPLQDQAASDESDKLDEIFLPRDTGMWEDQTKGVPNAFVDNDMKSSLDAIRAKGAFVWIVFDCCHSGSATRAAPVGEESYAERKVDFFDMVAPDAKEAAQAAYGAAAAATGTRGIGDDGERAPSFKLNSEPTGGEGIARGGMVAFYAAQSIETTPEMPLPKGQPDATKYGLFTFTIFSKMAENSKVTYRQLGHAVLQQYAADGRSRPTPLFEGELDARVFGSEIVETELQWPIAVKGMAASIPAGLMHRLNPGTKLAIVPSPISELSEAVGYVEIDKAENLSSRIRPVAFEGFAELSVDKFPANAYARVAELAVDYSLVVARPAPAPGLDAEVALANQTLETIAADDSRKFRIKLVEAGAEADLRFAVARENAIAATATGAAEATDKPALWFLPPSGDVSLQDGRKPPLVYIDTADPAKFEESVGKNFLTIYRATSLSRLAAASDYKTDQVNVTFLIKRADTGEMEPLVEAKVPFVMPDDEIHIKAKNNSSKIVDINVLYVGSDYSITHIDAQRLVQGAEIEEGLIGITDASFGMERMIAVFTEAPPQSEIEDLSFLAQDGVPATRSVGSRSPIAGVAGFSDMLMDIGLAPATRAAMKLGDKGGNKGAVMIFPMETVPRG
ncbi:MAG: caspase family protein [Rhizobiaceae bacterium]